MTTIHQWKMKLLRETNVLVSPPLWQRNLEQLHGNLEILTIIFTAQQNVLKIMSYATCKQLQKFKESHISPCARHITLYFFNQ